MSIGRDLSPDLRFGIVPISKAASTFSEAGSTDEGVSAPYRPNAKGFPGGRDRECRVVGGGARRPRARRAHADRRGGIAWERSPAPTRSSY